MEAPAALPGWSSSVFPQVASSEVHKDILEARLPGIEVQQFFSALVDGIEQGGNGQVRLAHIQADQIIVMAHSLDSRQSFPGLGAIFLSVHRELDQVMTS